jgi:hypothetical protein
MTKLTRLEVENFKRLSAIAITPNAHVTEISGKNMQGKTSLIDAIDVLLEGAAVAPPVPIRVGAEIATIRGTFGDMIAERVFRVTKTGKLVTEITLSTPEGARYPEPQKHLNDLIGRHKLDPLDFINGKPKERLDIVRGFGKNFDFETNEKERKAAFEKRTGVNVLAKKERAAADLINVPLNTPEKLVDESALSAAMEEASEDNRVLEQRISRRSLHANQIKAHRDDAEDLQTRIDGLLAQVEQLKKQKAHHVTLADEMQAELNEAEELPAPIDVSQLRAKLEAARKTNESVRQLHTKLEHKKAAEKHEKESDDLTAKITELEQAKKSAIAKADIPVSGIDFDEGDILLNGLPFEQASTAEKLRTAFALIAAQHPKFRLAWIRDGSLLDDDSMRIVDELAEQYDMQVFIETVRPTSKNAIVIEDGRRKLLEEAAA